MRLEMSSLQKRSFFTRRSHYQGQADSRNRKSGLGKQSQQNGLMYEGQWWHGMRHGYGVVYRKMPDTEMYVKIYAGNWQNDRKQGLGIKYYRNGKYLGFWKEDQRSGHGFMWFDSGNFYMGEWEADRFGGFGIYLSAGGNRYHGQFRDGKRHGEGIYLHSGTGQIQKGFWEQGMFKLGTIEDWNRNQVLFPTIYPIPELKLANFPQVYDEWMAKLTTAT